MVAKVASAADNVELGGRPHLRPGGQVTADVHPAADSTAKASANVGPTGVKIEVATAPTNTEMEATVEVEMEAGAATAATAMEGG